MKVPRFDGAALLPLCFGALALALGVVSPAYGAADGAGAGPGPYREVVEEKLSHAVVRGDTLLGIAGAFGVGLARLKAENGLNGDLIRPGEVLRTTRRTIVPSGVSDGILVNIPDRTLYLFRDGALAAHYPVGLGKPDWQTPDGGFSVIDKRKNPVWYVPASIQKEMEQSGEEVKTIVPPGPDNPLGRWALKTSIQGILIHETKAPESVFRFRSHGCIRMRGDDVRLLFDAVAIGDRGSIIYQPVKLAVTDDARVFLEVHSDFYGRGGDPLNAAAGLIIENGLYDRVDWEKVSETAAAKDGVATDVTLRVVRSADYGQKGVSEGGAGAHTLPWTHGGPGKTGRVTGHPAAL